MSTTVEDVVAAVEAAGSSGDSRGRWASEPTDRTWVGDLSAWKIYVTRAERANRNVIQYAGSFAALLGIGAGSGGVFAMAKAVNKSADGQLVPEWGLTVAFMIGAVIGLVLVALLWGAFQSRREAERQADVHLGKLIEKRPELFLPRSKGTE